MRQPDERARILLVDDQVLFVESLRCVLEDRARDMEVVGVANDGEEAVRKAMRLRPDIVLMDVRMPVMDGVDATRALHGLYPDMKIVMLTTFADDDYVKVALKYGAAGYLLKNMPPDDLIRSIRAVRQSLTQISPEVLARLVEDEGLVPRDGRAPEIDSLTCREKEILELLSEALGNRDIAEQLGVSDQTVKNHIHSIYEKLGVSNRLELLRLSRRGRDPGESA